MRPARRVAPRFTATSSAPGRCCRPWLSPHRRGVLAVDAHFKCSCAQRETDLVVVTAQVAVSGPVALL